jgi:hypothetical protein
MWTFLMATLSAAALAVVGCDPPPTEIPPGPTAIIAGPVQEGPLPSTPIDPSAMADADAGPGASSAEPEPAEGGGAAGGGAAGEVAGGLTRDGGLCEKASECASGTCEGQGCTPERKGICMARNRSCTRDLRTYCGCDGQTFRGSGSCPGRRFSARSACR